MFIRLLNGSPMKCSAKLAHVSLKYAMDRNDNWKENWDTNLTLAEKELMRSPEWRWTDILEMNLPLGFLIHLVR
jgi:hypothetical protein